MNKWTSLPRLASPAGQFNKIPTTKLIGLQDDDINFQQQYCKLDAFFFVKSKVKLLPGLGLTIVGVQEN